MQRAVQSFRNEELWDTKFRKHGAASASDKVPTVGKFEGDRDDLEEEYVRRGLTPAERRSFTSSPVPERKAKPEVQHVNEQPSSWMESKPQWMQKIAAKRAEPKEEIDVERSWVKPQHRKRNTPESRQKHYDKKKQKLKDNPELRAKKKEKDQARKMRRAQGEPPAQPPLVLRPNPNRPAKLGGPPAWTLHAPCTYGR